MHGNRVRGCDQLTFNVIDLQESEDLVDIAKAQKEAAELHKAGEKKWGTDESKFNLSTPIL